MSTTATFSKGGTYVLKFMADDGDLTGLHPVTIQMGSRAKRAQYRKLKSDRNTSTTP